MTMLSNTADQKLTSIAGRLEVPYKPRMAEDT
jgi:hypothetical protein